MECRSLPVQRQARCRFGRACFEARQGPEAGASGPRKRERAPILRTSATLGTSGDAIDKKNGAELV